jgi:hypothetical protein
MNRLLLASAVAISLLTAQGANAAVALKALRWVASQGI